MDDDALAMILAKAQEMVAEMHEAIAKLHAEQEKRQQLSMLENIPMQDWVSMQPHGPI